MDDRQNQYLALSMGQRIVDLELALAEAKAQRDGYQQELESLRAETESPEE